MIAEDGTSIRVVGVSVRDEDRADGGGIDADYFQSAANLERAEPGVKEQIAFGS